MSRKAGQLESQLQVKTFSEGVTQALSLLRELVASSLGPHGQIKMIQNQIGGHLTVTACSQRLFSAMSVSSPVIKLLISSVQGLIEKYRDGGMRACYLCLLLLESSMTSDIQRHLLTELYETMLGFSKDYLFSNEHKCTNEQMNLNLFYCIAKSVLCSKVSCCLHVDHVEEMTQVVLEAFLESLSVTKNQDFYSDRIYTLGLHSLDTASLVYHKGLMLDCPTLPSFEVEQLQVTKIPSGKIRIALVTVSLSGDCEEVLNARYELKLGLSMEDKVIENNIKLCSCFVEDQVGLVLCQKVIHPKVKVYLRGCNVLYLDRLGASSIPYLKDLTGATPINPSCTKESLLQRYGHLDELSHQVLCNRSYLLLQNMDSPLGTLAIGSPWEEKTEELKVTVQSALQALHTTFFNPVLLGGGGCWNTQMAAFVQHKVMENKDLLMAKFNCTQHQLQWAVNNFAHCLEKLALPLGTEDESHITDTTYHHCWRIPKGTDLSATGGNIPQPRQCCCGMVAQEMVRDFDSLHNSVTLTDVGIQTSPFSIRNVEKQVATKSLILDSGELVQKILDLSVHTANALLKICQTIRDVN